MKKFFIFTLCVVGIMSSCSDANDSFHNDAGESITLTQQEYESIAHDSLQEIRMLPLLPIYI
ncbi:hypothetical protein Premu_0624 [Hallella multisaccharivorax DSM 17128]|uniref:Lipoprotein n=1 Tax=Hallella multisaccharivorax DSM 17128 TaxID=688246 RepID=F8N5T8_9BACT|nr:hypothetical protein Premu_0624 [Hallella multisaccharivorax DSM 17128]